MSDERNIGKFFSPTGGVGRIGFIVDRAYARVSCNFWASFGVGFSDVLLILTTLLSLEAIYLAILVQMTLNRHTRSLQDVRSDVEELQTDVEELIDESE